MRPQMAPYRSNNPHQQPGPRKHSRENGFVGQGTGWQPQYYRSSMVQLPVPPRRRDPPPSTNSTDRSPRLTARRPPSFKGRSPPLGSSGSPSKPPMASLGEPAYKGGRRDDDVDDVLEDVLQQFQKMNSGQTSGLGNAYQYKPSAEVMEASLTPSSNESPRKPMSPARILRIGGEPQTEMMAWMRFEEESSNPNGQISMITSNKLET